MVKSAVEEYYDKHAKEYSPGKFSPSDVGLPLFFADQITWHFLRKYAPKNKSGLILDAGAGTGDWALLFVKLGYENLVLAEISWGMLNEARKKFASLKKKVNVRFVKADIADMEAFAANTFDYVFSQYDAVSYCLRPREAVKELARVAKKHAHVAVTLDTKYRRVPELIEAGQIKQAQELLRTGISYDMGYPQYDLTWEELATYFEQAGLEVVEVIGAPVFMDRVKDEVLNKLKQDPKIRKILLKIEFDHCTNRSLVNLAGHLQMVGRKK